MKLLLELAEEEYERVLGGQQRVITGSVDEVEVRKEGALVTASLRCCYVERLSFELTHKLGLADGKPAMTIWLEPEEETHNVGDQ